MTVVRKATYHDVMQIYQLQCRNYTIPSLWESRTFLHHIISLGLSYVAVNTRGEIIAYALIHYLSNPSDPPHLNQRRLPSHGSAWFLHDLCVDIPYRQQGIAKQLLETLLAAKYPIYLIALESVKAFWIRHGFTEITTNLSLRWNYRKEYGAGATYLWKK